LKIIINLFFILCTISISFAQTSGLSFLKIGVSGRATGMAEAFTAVTDDATATYWNPAGLMLAKDNHLSLTHNEWLDDVRSEYAAFVLPKDTYSLGFSLNSTNISGIEIRGNQPTIEPISTFDSHDLAFGVSYARPLNPQLNVGITLKYIYEKIYIDESSGAAGDFGLTYNFNSIPIQAGMVLQNIGFMADLKNEAPSLPKIFRLGLAFKPEKFLTNGSWLVASDLVYDFDSNYHFNFGLEYRFQKFLALRAGYQSGYDIKDIHFGFGLISNRFLLDYGYVPLKQDFGQGHRITFGVIL